MAALALGLLLSACSPAPQQSGINDPYENTNRGIHGFNKGVDRVIFRRGAQAYGGVVPEPVRDAVSNFVGNVDMPRMVVNDIFQARLEDAFHNTFRFLVNTTFGLGGVLDPAGELGLTARDSDFGETLHVWGAGEGAYVEMPLIGPSTSRDAIGWFVDFGLNPLRYAIPTAEQNALLGLKFASRLGDRNEYAATVDSILYESADSYAQARILYLQNRRFKLGGTTSVESGATGGAADEDPYFDPYYEP